MGSLLLMFLCFIWYIICLQVVSTPAHLDVKIRVAQGLSREGWSITKNLLTEVTILTIGLFTLVPAIQEFCIFAIVGLLSDFFLQVNKNKMHM